MDGWLDSAVGHHLWSGKVLVLFIGEDLEEFGIIACFFLIVIFFSSFFHQKDFKIIPLIL